MLPLEHKILRALRAREASGRPILVAVSGGVDSMVCLSILVRLRPLLKNEIFVIHVHHGRKNAFRDQALRLVRKTADGLGVAFYGKTYRGKKALHSEAELRQFRWRAIREIQKVIHNSLGAEKDVLIATGHNADDLLETRLLRLLRGTGLRGMPAMDPSILRPLLETTRDEILEYAHAIGLHWVEDPSNRDLDPRRNWLRHVWLPQLKQKWPSANRTLARSLDIIAAEWSRASERRRTTTKGLLSGQRISRPKFLALSRDEKTACLADYLLLMGVREFTHGQILEILRQLDKARRHYKFTAVRTEWMVTPREIRAKI